MNKLTNTGKIALLAVFVLVSVLFLSALKQFNEGYTLKLQSPFKVESRTPYPVDNEEVLRWLIEDAMKESGCYPKDEEAMVEPTAIFASVDSSKEVLGRWSGIASYYSHDGCIGCSEGQIMSNGEPFDENAMTLAFNELPLNTEVIVVNKKTRDSKHAIVTDRHGADNAEYGFRVADLSKGLRDAINCSHLCEVEIWETK